jgi:cyclophilin family peptidyl-prolyl cis-trans isomerase/HEAT repeat protein
MRSLAMHRATLGVTVAAALTAVPDIAFAQAATRLAILQAEDRRAPTAQDLVTIRAGTRSSDGQTARMAVRALGRLERPALIDSILPALRHRLPEVRAEAANALAQAAHGARSGAALPTLATTQAALHARLQVDDDAGVRAAVCESIARLPYRNEHDIARAETILLEFAPKATSNTDRLGLAKGLEALARLHHGTRPLAAPAIDLLRQLARNEHTEGEALRDARVRRLAVEALVAVDATDAPLIIAAASDPDPQTRRLAVRAAASRHDADAALTRGTNDPVPMVRIEALRALRSRGATELCGPALAATTDPETNVVLVAVDQLAACGTQPDAVTFLEQAVADLVDAEVPRNWHRAAHALVALAQAAPGKAAEPLGRLAASRVWQLRMYSTRAAATLKQRPVLDALLKDANPNVVEAAIVGLSATVGHDADAQYVAALQSGEFQTLRAAALALARSPAPGAVVPALRAALDRLDADARPGASDARAAIRDTLASLGEAVKPPRPVTQPAAPLSAADLRRLAAPRARFTIRDVGEFDVALFTMEAPATVLRFAQLAESGYYDGLTFHRVEPNAIVQGGSPGANEYASDVPLMRDEVGLWPHVRGALGISTRGRDTGDGQIFVDLVDNPRFDHTYTVFAQVLNGIDVLDRLLEGDVIDRVEILP